MVSYENRIYIFILCVVFSLLMTAAGICCARKDIQRQKTENNNAIMTGRVAAGCHMIGVAIAMFITSVTMIVHTVIMQ